MTRLIKFPSSGVGCACLEKQPALRMVLLVSFVCATCVAARHSVKPPQQSHHNKHGQNVAQSQNDLKLFRCIQNMFQSTTQQRSHDKPHTRLPGSSHHDVFACLPPKRLQPAASLLICTTIICTRKLRMDMKMIDVCTCPTPTGATHRMFLPDRRSEQR